MNIQRQVEKYNYYAEHMTRFMTQTGLIVEEEAQELELFIRGCA